jgi:hypothetical protein
MKLYAHLAGLVGAYHRCCAADANESQQSWAPKHRAKIEALVKEHMPSGSGFDHGTTISLNSSTDNRLAFDTSFHHMDEGGGYAGWTEHTVFVTPSLWNGFELRITGNNRGDIKGYIHGQFDAALNTVIIPNQRLEDQAMEDWVVLCETHKLAAQDRLELYAEFIKKNDLLRDFVNFVNYARSQA